MKPIPKITTNKKSNQMENPKAYQWDFENKQSTHAIKNGNAFCNTFSVGIYQWIPKSTRKGLKKTGAIIRVVCSSNNPKPGLVRARALCDYMNTLGDVSSQSKKSLADIAKKWIYDNPPRKFE